VDQAVRVQATSEAGSLDFSREAGEPISAAALERLFQPFYRNALHDREDKKHC